MVEAVGLRFWPIFATLDRLLRPGGRIGLQSITVPHDRMWATHDSYTWIHKYIFPGGIVPSIEAIDDARAAHVADHCRAPGFGPDYAATLKCWRDRSSPTGRRSRVTASTALQAHVGVYLAYCEAGFRSWYLGVSQFSLAQAWTR